MAFVPQGQQSFGTMTVDENLHVVADRYGSEAKARYDEAVTMFPVLKEFAVERGLRVKMCVWLGVSRGLDLAFLNAD